MSIVMLDEEQKGVDEVAIDPTIGMEADEVLTEWQHGGRRLQIRADGRAWKRTLGLDGLGAAWTPMPWKEWRKTVDAGRDLGANDGATVIGWDMSKAIPDVRVLLYWRRRLEAAADGESVAYMFRKEVEGEYMWTARVPTQEASGGHWDSPHYGRPEDKSHLDRTILPMLRDGWDVIGHMHVHPHGMYEYSRTDEADWEGRPGVYVVAPRNTNEMGVYMSMGGVVFTMALLDTENVEPAVPTEEENGRIKGENGGDDLSQWIKERLAPTLGEKQGGLIGYDPDIYDWLLMKLRPTGDELEANRDEIGGGALGWEPDVVVEIDEADIAILPSGALVVVVNNYSCLYRTQDRLTSNELRSIPVVARTPLADVLDESLLVELYVENDWLDPKGETTEREIIEEVDGARQEYFGGMDNE